MVPDKKSYIVQSSGSLEKTGGHWIAIMLDVPEIYRHLDVKEETVYFLALQPSSPIKQLEHVYHQAVELTYDEYLELLKFFAEEWPAYQEHANQQIACMRRESVPTMIAPGLYFFMDGTVQFEKRFGGEARLIFQKHSTDQKSGYEMYLQNKGKTSRVHSQVMVKMARQHAVLEELLTDFVISKHQPQSQSSSHGQLRNGL